MVAALAQAILIKSACTKGLLQVASFLLAKKNAK